MKEEEKRIINRITKALEKIADKLDLICELVEKERKSGDCDTDVD